ncbi:IclR family transcriptional regulator [Paenibacillus lupini]|uniref:IclR family transcriptional regulator n=1 Tax=Paenibacillus lupini TaxID=1450204 RepID=UPI00141E206F|nr:IclR family transcriptional regulator [Paenibacillus lupini]
MTRKVALLKTLDNSLELLNYFTKETPQWGVRELAKAMEMNHSIVFRILATFEQHGFLMQDKDTKKYSLGEIVESSQTIRYGVTVGSRSPLYTGASNKVIMAFLPKEEQESLMSNGLQPFTNKTIVSEDALRLDLEKIRAAGWAYSVGEYTESVFALSLPLFNASREVVSSLTVGGPEFRMSPEKIEAALQKLSQGRQLAVITVPREKLILSTTMRNPKLLKPVEEIIGKSII